MACLTALSRTGCPYQANGHLCRSVGDPQHLHRAVLNGGIYCLWSSCLPIIAPWFIQQFRRAGKLFNHECRREVGYIHRTTSAVLSIHHTVRARTLDLTLFVLQEHSMENSPIFYLGLDGTLALFILIPKQYLDYCCRGYLFYLYCSPTDG